MAFFWLQIKMQILPVQGKLLKKNYHLRNNT